jgi:hypothetical protein
VLSEFRPDLHLSEDEKLTPPFGLTGPYWVLASGGKRDYTAKWWDPVWWQQVADTVGRHARVVQVGGGSHIHPKLHGVHDLVAKTSFRELMRLIYHSHGVLCVVTCLMHIAAAFNKPCVVVAGGREPWWWEAYNLENRLINMRLGQPSWQPPEPDNFVPHRFIHTIGQLDCCQTGGCWKSRVETGNSLCSKVVVQNGRKLPQCLQMITPEMVVANWKWYYDERILSLEKAATISLPPEVTTPRVLPGLPDPPSPTLGSVRFAIYTTPGPEAAVYAEQMVGHAPEPARCLLLCNGVDEPLRQLAKTRGLTLYDDLAAPGRPVLMRKAAELVDAEWFLWCEPPARAARVGWLADIAKKLHETGCHAAGLTRWSYLEERHEAFLKLAGWDGAFTGDRHPLTMRRRVFYPARGFFLVSSRLFLDLKWPDARVNDEDLELMLGAGLSHLGARTADVGSWVEYL